MNRRLRTAVAVAALTSVAGQGLAQTTPAPPPVPVQVPAAPAPAPTPPPQVMYVPATSPSPAPAATPVETPSKRETGSFWVQCDGQPASMSGAELTAYLLAISFTGGIVGGLVGAPETGDVGKRIKGDDAIAACDQALAKETEAVRKVQLSLARSIHQIEAKRYDAALIDIRAIPTLAGDKAQETDFQRSLGLSLLELEAITLVRLGKPAEAEAAAMKMAEAAPYDVLNQIRVLKYANLTAEMTPAKAAYFDRFVRIFPASLVSRYEARLWQGDFTGAAADLERYDAVQKAFFPNDAEPLTISTARRAAAYMLAGDLERSNALAVEARAAVEKLIRSGKASESANVISQVEELLDFQAVGRQLAEGKVKEARAAFASRSRWLAPKAPAVALLTERLRAGATPTELTGALSRDPAAIRAEGLAIASAAIREPDDETKALFGTIRPYIKNGHAGFTRAVWKTDKSRYLVKRSDKAKYTGELVYIYGAYGQAGGEALLMHCALLAKARGKSGFMVGANRKELDSTLVLFGNPGDPGTVEGMVVDADAVIRALSGEMPEPERRR
jgi:hypothetical protein